MNETDDDRDDRLRLMDGHPECTDEPHDFQETHRSNMTRRSWYTCSKCGYRHEGEYD